MLTAFLGCLLGFTLIGIASASYSRGTGQDYYLASQSVPPWLVGLSAVATNNSGYMFIGMIGYTYVVGLPSVWLMVGWIAGDFLASRHVHGRLRVAAERTGEVSYAGVLARWQGDDGAALQRLIGAISLLCLLVYASAQFVAGGKALEALLDWPLWAGACLSALLVTFYCFAGGIRASIWTDAAQSLVMMLAMALLLAAGIDALGGPDDSLARLRAVPAFMQWTPTDLVVPGVFGGLLFALGWLGAGLSVIGQPHIMVRFMALSSARRMASARVWYYSWYLVFYALTIGVGLLSRVLLDPGVDFDPELALPSMAEQLLPAPLVGLILAGLFAATMSTADSLVLSCSAAVTHDILPHRVERPALLKVTTIIITAVALAWALGNRQSVFSLVILAWSGLASAFAPLLIALCLGWHPSRKLSAAAIVLGLAVALGWRALGWQHWLYEGVPGMVAGLLLLRIPAKMNTYSGKAGKVFIKNQNDCSR